MARPRAPRWSVTLLAPWWGPTWSARPTATRWGPWSSARPSASPLGGPWWARPTARWAGPRRRGGDRDRDRRWSPGWRRRGRGPRWIRRLGCRRPSGRAPAVGAAVGSADRGAVVPGGQDDGPRVQTTRGARTAAFCARCAGERGEGKGGARQHIGTVCAPARIAPRCAAKGESKRGGASACRNSVRTGSNSPACWAWYGAAKTTGLQSRECNPASKAGGVAAAPPGMRKSEK